MGYRSEVAFCLEGPVKQMDALLAEMQMRHNINILEMDGNLKVGTYTAEPSGTLMKAIHYHQDCVKWYDSYPFVRAQTWLFDLAKDKNLASRWVIFHGAFCRVGEEVEDMEQDYIGDGYDLIDINRSIEVDFPELTEEPNDG